MSTGTSGTSRRSLLRASALGLGASVVGAPLLAACGGSSSGGGANTAKGLAAVLPDYVPQTGGPKPDIAPAQGAHGAMGLPGYLSYPTDLVKTVHDKPGSGGSYRAITPLWGSIPPAGNDYYQAVNKALGATVTVSPANGNNYDSVVPTLVSGNKLPAWIQLPTWWNSTFNTGELADTKFADLTDFLSGKKIRKYPNLAAIPTGGWQTGAWNNRLYGIPSFTVSGGFAGALYYRKDVFDAKGIDPDDVKDADDLYHLGGQLTAAKSNVWAFDVIWLMIQQMFNVPPNPGGFALKGDRLVSAFDTPEMEAGLEFAYKLAKSGYVHPDGLAGDTSNGKQRFYSGHTLVVSDGTGAWNAADAQQGRAANPGYVRDAFKLFSHNGSTPTINLSPSTQEISYLSNKLSHDQIEECLRIADYLASPWGSYEYTLVFYGVEGVDWTRGRTGPTYTTKGQRESSPVTYGFLCAPESVVSNPGYNDVTRLTCAWVNDAVKYAYKPVFWNMNVDPPSRFASISTAQEVADTINQVTYGKKTVGEYKATVKNWKSSGGSQLIDWYQKNVYDKYGSGQ